MPQSPKRVNPHPPALPQTGQPRDQEPPLPTPPTHPTPQPPTHAAVPAEPRGNLAVLLQIADETLTHATSESLRAAGFADLRPAHIPIFQHIRAEGSRVTELAQRTRLTLQAVRYLTVYLEAHDYLTRTPDPHDGRGTLLHLTPHGWHAVNALRHTQTRIYTDWNERLGNQRLDELKALLADLASTLARHATPIPRNTPQPTP
jgi:DNA-binding MarR family transcriptional regulator